MLIIKGKTVNVNGLGIADVTVTVTYQTFTETGNNLSYNSPQTSNATSDNNGNFTININASPSSKLLTGDPAHPIIITCVKEGFDPITFRNPYINRQNIGRDTVYTTELQVNSYIDPNNGGTFDLKGNYLSGKWKVMSLPENAKNTLNGQIENIYEFIKNHPQNFTVIIDSSESQVPNNDNEEGSNRNFSRPGSLAQARADDLKEYVNIELQRLNSLSSTPINNLSNLDIRVNTARVGSQKWGPTETAKNNLLLIEENDKRRSEGQPELLPDQIYLLPRYVEDQWVKITANLLVARADCLDGYIVFDITYLAGNGHGCDSAVYELYANDILLNRDDGKPYASLNNGHSLGQYDNDKFQAATATFYSLSTNEIRYFTGGSQRLSDPELGNLANLIVQSVKRHNSALNGYHLKANPYNPENLGRFKELERGDIFPMIVNPIPNDQIPTVSLQVGSSRFNRFIITPELSETLVRGRENSLITFKISCVGMNVTFSSKDIPISMPEYRFDCHKGVGNFQIYNLRENENGDLIVNYTSGQLSGKSPEKRNSKMELFTYDPCTNAIINKNAEVFAYNISDIKSDRGQ